MPRRDVGAGQSVRRGQVRPRLQLVCPTRGPALGACEQRGGTLLSRRELQNGKIPRGWAPGASAVGTIVEEEGGGELGR